MKNTKKCTDTLTKWAPIMENLGIVNKHLSEVMSFFCENYIVNNPDSDDLPEKVNNLLLKLQNSEKSEIKRTLYNPISGEIEYELENGFIITEKNKFKREPTIEEMVDLFGIDFIRELDTQKWREHTLNKIL